MIVHVPLDISRMNETIIIIHYTINLLSTLDN